MTENNTLIRVQVLKDVWLWVGCGVCERRNGDKLHTLPWNVDFAWDAVELRLGRGGNKLPNFLSLTLSHFSASSSGSTMNIVGSCTGSGAGAGAGAATGATVVPSVAPAPSADIEPDSFDSSLEAFWGSAIHGPSFSSPKSSGCTFCLFADNIL